MGIKIGRLCIKICQIWHKNMPDWGYKYARIDIKIIQIGLQNMLIWGEVCKNLWKFHHNLIFLWSIRCQNMQVFSPIWHIFMHNRPIFMPNQAYFYAQSGIFLCQKWTYFYAKFWAKNASGTKGYCTKNSFLLHFNIGVNWVIF